MERVDVAIVGAGIAGCLAARNLARQGKKVLLIERLPKDRLGHNWWDSVEECVFAEVGLPNPVPPERMNPTGAVRIFSPMETVNFVSDALSYKPNVNRRHLAQRLIGYALDAGSRFIDRTAAVGPVIENGAVTGLIYRTADGSTTQVNAKITIDASGMSGVLRSKLPERKEFPRFIAREDTFVTWREIRENQGMPETESMLVFGKQNGVRWIKRAQKGYVDYFAGTINNNGRPSPHAIVREMLEATTGYGPEILMGGYGAPIPVRREFDSLVANGFMLTGDSGCQCNPLDGSGILSSLLAAHHASRVALEALDAGRFDEEALWPYNPAYKRTQGAKYSPNEMIQKFLLAAPKPSLEALFTKGILSKDTFRQDPDKPKQSKLAMLPKILKLGIVKPSFTVKLVKVFSAVDKFGEHYKQFPENYNPAEFDLWATRAKQLFDISRG
ncbi:MAG TPA: NAD(P)/FAD-dependent oxidoreductase [bacterium]|nr:NAD(P)/FAD-dependent oxidoreductase [bacterium]